MIGISFAVTGSDARSSVPWNLVEAHRQVIEAKYGNALERLDATGGTPLVELAALIGGQDAIDHPAAHALLDEHFEALKKVNYMQMVGKLVIALCLAGWLLAGHAVAQNVSPPPYAAGATPVHDSQNYTSGITTATLAAAAKRTTYICSFVVSSGGTTSPIVANVTITGLKGGMLNYQYVFVSSGQGLLGTAFPACLPASGVNVPIQISVPDGGAGTQMSVTVTGYQITGSSP